MATTAPRAASVRSGRSRDRILGRLLLLLLVAGLLGSSGPPVPPSASDAAESAQAPPPGGHFSLEPVGAWSRLPGDAEAAAMVRRSAWEPRPENAAANRTVPGEVSLRPRGGVAPQWNEWLLPRVTGNFSGTTDEIVQWAAAKWGLPDEVLRAQMVAESSWYQNRRSPDGSPVRNQGFGDYTEEQRRCAPGYEAPCPTSFGVLQVKHTDHPDTFPHSSDSTAFNLDYAAAVLRGCYEGWEIWLRDWGGSSDDPRTDYAAGDLEGCLGRWYAGTWHTRASANYIASVRRHLDEQPWLSPGF